MQNEKENALQALDMFQTNFLLKVLGGLAHYWERRLWAETIQPTQHRFQHRFPISSNICNQESLTSQTAPYAKKTEQVLQGVVKEQIVK